MMPYITQEDRVELKKGRAPMKAGELNYEFTLALINAKDYIDLQHDVVRAIDRYLEAHDPINYQIINDVIGALVCATTEFKRRTKQPYPWQEETLAEISTDFYEQIAVPYEKGKIRANGDVYPEEDDNE